MLILMCLLQSCYCILLDEEWKIGAMGTLLCRSQPTAARIELWDKKINNRNLAVNLTNIHGFFTIKGKAKEFSRINPYLKIYHRCMNDTRCRKFRMIRVEIPQDYVRTHTRPVQYFDLHTVELLTHKQSALCVEPIKFSFHPII
ncbi:unnamed protein product [Cylicocyclus nassatus]|uniref:Transthyretin-like family protein n=1 Tax=Cylicocyclus nassatus TaxID=53992 RepID=A0AA36GZU3_CYLNA|nr:unnamed protein product [Cylicocyclus nassatus]